MSPLIQLCFLFLPLMAFYFPICLNVNHNNIHQDAINLAFTITSCLTCAKLKAAGWKGMHSKPLRSLQDQQETDGWEIISDEGENNKHSSLCQKKEKVRHLLKSKRTEVVLPKSPL